jgi:hypothetical protein
MIIIIVVVIIIIIYPFIVTIDTRFTVYQGKNYPTNASN